MAPPATSAAARHFLGAPAAEGTEDDCDSEDDPWLLVAAETIGLTPEALLTAIEGGQSIADAARANDVDPQTVIDAIIAAEQGYVQEWLDEGDITQAEADEWLFYLPEEAQYFVAHTADYMTYNLEDEDWFALAAIAILRRYTDDGQSIADAARANGLDPQTVIDAIVTEERQYAQEELDAGEITQAEADEWLAEMDVVARDLVENTDCF